jgi:uncharacterized protein (DUF2249 family)
MAQLDVRTIQPSDCHPMIFNPFERLQPGESFDLVNDHAPIPPYYQLLRCALLFEGKYLEEGPQTWRVRITRKVEG